MTNVEMGGAASGPGQVSDAALSIDCLSVRFRQRSGETAWVVRDVRLSLRPGEIFGLIGESGSGKSMLALTIMGLLPKGAVTEGEVRFEGRNLLTLSGREMRRLRGRRLAMIFQDPGSAFNPTLRVGDQVVEPFVVHEGISRRRALKRAPRLLGQVHISDPAHRARQYAFQLSGGMLQRAMAATAMALRPSLLIADEPTTGLDVTIQAGILALLREIRDELRSTVLFITHDLAVVSQLCDRVAVMYAGEVVEVGSVEEVIGAPKHPYTQALLRVTPRVGARREELEVIPGGLPSPADVRPGCRFADRCPVALEQCALHHPTLTSRNGHEVRCWLAKEPAR